MSNVLPQHAQIQVTRANRARFLLTGACVLSAAALVALISLAPAYLAIVLPRMSLSDVFQGVSQEQRVQEDADREVAAHTRTLLAALAPFAEEKMPVHPIVARVFELQPTGISIESVVYGARTTEGEITIVGTTLSREHVNAYREALAAEPVFTSVTVPVAALVGASEGNFTMTLIGKF